MEDDSVRRKLDLSPQFRRLYLKPDREPLPLR